MGKDIFIAQREIEHLKLPEKTEAVGHHVIESSRPSLPGVLDIRPLESIVIQSSVSETNITAEPAMVHETSENPFYTALTEKVRKGRRRIPLEAQLVFDKKDVTAVDWKEEVEELIKKQARLERHSYDREFARVKINSKLPVGIVATGDWHMGAEGTDYVTWRRHMQLIKDTPNVFMIPHGNTIDNFIFPSGMFEQMSNPEEQARLVESFARDYREKFVAIIGSRCHEGWDEQKVGKNLYERLFKDNLEVGTPFFATGGVTEIDLNGIKYTWGAVHQARFHSALNPTNANRQLHDLRWPVDIVSIAHHHTAQVLQTTKYESVFEKPLVEIRVGSYKRRDSYSEGEGFGTGDVASPIVILDPDKKHMIAFYNLEDGINYLNTLREIDALKRVKK